MPRSVTLWRTWDAGDMANSDNYFATKKEALASLKRGYDVTKLAKSDWGGGDDTWEGEIPVEVGGGGEVYLQRIEVELTRAGVAYALKNIPHR